MSLPAVSPAGGIPVQPYASDCAGARRATAVPSADLRDVAQRSAVSGRPDNPPRYSATVRASLRDVRFASNRWPRRLWV